MTFAIVDPIRLLKDISDRCDGWIPNLSDYIPNTICGTLLKTGFKKLTPCCNQGKYEGKCGIHNLYKDKNKKINNIGNKKDYKICNAKTKRNKYCKNKVFNGSSCKYHNDIKYKIDVENKNVTDNINIEANSKIYNLDIENENKFQKKIIEKSNTIKEDSINKYNIINEYYNIKKCKGCNNILDNKGNYC